MQKLYMSIRYLPIKLALFQLIKRECLIIPSISFAYFKESSLDKNTHYTYLRTLAKLISSFLKRVLA